MRLTSKILHSAGTEGIGYNAEQLKLLGIAWPPVKGWLTGLINTEICDTTWELIMELKGKRRAQRRLILERYGVNPARLFHEKLTEPFKLW